MKHVWLPTLGVWAQAHEMPSEGAVLEQQTTGSTDAESCSPGPGRLGHSLYSGRRERHCRDDHRCSSKGGHQNDMHGDCDLQSRCHLRIGDEGHHGDCGDEFHHDGDGCCESCHEPRHTCPICLSPIRQAGLTVLCWCMHRFCLSCIEKWSTMQRFCPLCKQTFQGWYYNIQSPSVFDYKDFDINPSSQPPSQHHAQGRRDRSSVLRPRISKPFPWKRTLRRINFGRGAESEGDEHALHWRASIYKKNLRAVPFILNTRVKKINQAPVTDPDRRARIERRLEPWIHRELRAITGDVDHSLLVHLVLSLWLQFLAQKEQACGDPSSSRQPLKRVQQAGFKDNDALRQLKPFLQEKASSFWYELRCFAESPYSLQAYDSVVEYKKYRG